MSMFKSFGSKKPEKKISKQEEQQKQFFDKYKTKENQNDYLIMNPNLQGMLGLIQHKQKNNCELGRILKDKGYDRVKSMDKEVALRVHVRLEDERKKEKLRQEEAERKKLNTFNF